jgi:RsiW-degrading membrane proteinase PrsW (M82 family)
MGGGDVPNSGRPPGGQFPSYSFSHLVPIRHWVRDPALRSWPVLLLVALVCVPPIALVMLNNATEAKIRDVAWIFAIYFAVAWLLLLGVIVRPQHVTKAMLAAVAVAGIVTQAPTAIFLETQLHSSTGSLLDIFTIGIPEELAKAIPIVVVAWIWRHYWNTQTPRDYLFLGAVSGLVFGAAEVVHYFTDVLGSVSGNATGPELQAITIQYVWRFLTDPIDHACWAGITGYFIGLAITGPVRKYSLGLVGIAIAAVLHGLNDWNPINSHVSWVLVTLVSVLLFLGYARAGAWLPEQALASPPAMAEAPLPPVPAYPWAAYPAGHAPQGYPPSGQAPPAAQPRPAGYGAPAGPAVPAAPAAAAAHGGSPPVPARPAPASPPPSRTAWWQRAPAAGARTGPPAPQPAHASSAPPDHTAPVGAAPPHGGPTSATVPPTVVQPRPAPKPWWEQ